MMRKNEWSRVGLLKVRGSMLFVAESVESCAKALALAICCLVAFWPTAGVAQNIRNPQSAVDNLMRGSSRINPATGAMQLQVPLGEYRGRGQASLPVTLYYSSRVWNMKFKSSSTCDGTSMISSFQADYAHGSVSGWTSSLDWFMPREDKSLETYDVNGHPSNNGTLLTSIARIYATLPDGSRHELRADDKLHSLSETTPPQNYYAVDGSQLRWERATDTLYMPDGSRFVNWSATVQDPSQTGNPLQYFDRNGNYMSFDGTRAPKAWTDTLGRSLALPIGDIAPASGDYEYDLPGVNGTIVKYILRWRNLGDKVPGTSTNYVLTDPQALLKYPGDWTSSLCSGLPPQSNNLFSSSDQEKISRGLDKFNPVVLWQISLPNNTNYTFTYNIYGEIDHIVYPTGGSESFTYNQLQPLGDQLDTFSYLQASRGVSSREINDGTTSQTWQYNSHFLGIGVDSATLPRTIVSPDGTTTETWYFKSLGSDIKYGFDDARTGMAREERVYDSNDNMIRRTLMKLAQDKPVQDNPKGATRNARVMKRVEIVLDTGGDHALASSTEMDYDSYLNVTNTKQYDYVSITQTDAKTADFDSIPTGALVQTEETDYLATDLYRARNLLRLPTAMRTRDSVGNLVAQRAIAYDEPSYAVTTSGTSPLNWIDPGTVRGNATSVGEWLDTTNTFLQKHSKYDQFGNVRVTKDPKGNESTIDYAAQVNGSSTIADFQYAYPTTLTSAIPDPDGNTGSAASLVTKTTYDFNTGLVTSTTDANNQKTTFGFGDSAGVDPLNRVRTVSYPDGGLTTFKYNDVPGKLFVETVTKQDSAHDINAYQFFDGLGRPTRSFLSVGGDNYNTGDTAYDSMGRVWRVSNPYVSSNPDISTGALSPINPSGNWTTTLYDALSRVVTVTSPDNAIATTVYGGNTTMTLGATVVATDQAGKSRRSLTDALGRLIRLDEPNSSGTLGDAITPNQPTTYSYDTLGNLRAVTQGEQHRFFMYDSLSRLIRVNNPEQTVNQSLSPILTDSISGNGQWCVSYTYDDNGNLTQKIDARNITTSYLYDALNRVTSRSYSDGTPTVSYGYDALTVANSKGRPTSVSSSVSSYSYSAYDALGRTLGGTQTTDGTLYPMTYGYNLAGGMTSEKYPSGKVVATEYDSAGRISGVKNEGSGTYYAGGSPSAADASTYQYRILYWPHGAIQDLHFGNGLWEHSKFNSRLQPNEIGLGTGQGGVDRLKLTYDYGTTDNNGNVKSQVIVVPTNVTGFTATQTYSYDQSNRLSAAQEIITGNTSPTWTQIYTYDRYGNRSLAAGTTLPGQLSNLNNPTIRTSDNRIDRFATNQGNVRYDNEGNFVTDVDGRSFGYDAENLQVSYNGGSQQGGANYNYDGEGRRVKKETSAGITIFVYDVMGHLVAEYSNATQMSSGGISYLTEDALGTPRIITGASGNILARHDYLPFGEELYFDGNRPSVRTAAQIYVGDNIKQKFTSKERDVETGLDFFGARYFSGAQGKWTSPDAINLTDARILNPSNTLNKYIYGGNNPLKYTDPDGRDITVFYSGGGVAGHFWMVAYDPQSGEHAVRDFGPAEGSNPIKKALGMDVPGDSNYAAHMLTVDEVRNDYASLTIQTNPADTQKAINLINSANATVTPWSLSGSNCTTVCRDVLSKILKVNSDDIEPAALWKDLYANWSRKAMNDRAKGVNTQSWLWGRMNTSYTYGIDHGQPRHGMNTFDFVWLLLHPKEPPKGCVTTDKVGGGTEKICE